MPCRSCREPQHCIGKQTPLPKKRDDREWQALRDWFFQERRKFADFLSRRRTRLGHELERQIQEVEERPVSKSRSAELKRLTEYLGEVRAWSLENSFGYWHLRRPDFEEHVAARKATWIARLEHALRRSEASGGGASPWNRSRRDILRRLEEVRNWSPGFDI